MKTKQNPNRAKLTIVALTGCAFLMAACGPKGINTRTIHPPHPQQTIYQRDQKSPTGITESRARRIEQSKTGIPNICWQFDREGKPCIECELPVIHAIRCLPKALPAGWFEASCRHTPRALKCFSQNPAVVLAMNLKISNEREYLLLGKNISETLTTIITNEVNSDEERRRVLALIALIPDILKEVLTEPHAPSLPSMAGLAKLTPSEQESVLEVIQNLAKNIQQSREEGHLNAALAVQCIRQIIAALSNVDQSLQIIDQLSIDSLSQPDFF